MGQETKNAQGQGQKGLVWWDWARRKLEVGKSE